MESTPSPQRIPDESAPSPLADQARERIWFAKRLAATYWQILRHPLSFLDIRDQAPSRYVKATELASSSLAIAFVLNYVAEWLANDPLIPYGSSSTISVATLIVGVCIFAGIWLLFAVFVPRVIRRFRRKKIPLERVPFLRLVNDLIYIFMGPIFVFGSLLLAIPIATFTRAPELADSPRLALVFLLLGSLSYFALVFLSALFLTKAVRNTYTVGFVRGVILPTLLMIGMIGANNYFFGTIRLSGMTPEEREAVSRLYVISDLESIYSIENGRWTDDLNDLIHVNATLGDSPWVNMTLPILKGKASDYRRSMAHYRYQILIYDRGVKCLVMAKPLDYRGATKRSFGTVCGGVPGVQLPARAKDTRGGDVVLGGSKIVLAAPRWYLDME